MKKFWMLYVEGGESREEKHLRLNNAENEAHRLAEALGKPVYVLEAIRVGTPKMVTTWEDLEL